MNQIGYALIFISLIVMTYILDKINDIINNKKIKRY